jgi:hypothetical protein
VKRKAEPPSILWIRRRYLALKHPARSMQMGMSTKKVWSMRPLFFAPGFLQATKGNKFKRGAAFMASRDSPASQTLRAHVRRFINGVLPPERRAPTGRGRRKVEGR